MTERQPRLPRPGASLLTGTTLLLGFLACSAPPPSDSASTGGVDEAARPVFTPYSVAPNLDNAPQVAAELQSAHAALEDAPEGRVDVWYFIGEDGMVQDTRIARSSGSSELDRLALQVAVDMRFTPALNRDRATPVWVSLPVVFGGGDASPAQPSDDSPPQPAAVVSNPTPGAVEAEGTGVITGVVRDAATERPLQFGQVYLPESRRGTLTDGEGRFRIDGVPTGYHELAVELIGYRLSEARVAVGTGFVTEMEIPLPATALQLQPLVVTPGG